MPLRFGEYELEILADGPWWLDGGALFGRVPRVVWEKELAARGRAPDAEHRVELEAYLPLLRRRDAVVLVDAGLGTKLTPEAAARYRVEPGAPRLLGALAALGLAPEEVTHVVLTHLHFDHAGGATRLDARGQAVPAFPRARYYVQRAERELLDHPTELTRGTYLPENLLPVEAAGRLELVHGDWELLPGMKFLATGGHTRGHQVMLLDGGADGRVFFWGDLMPALAHRFPAWIPAYDHFPDETLERKKEFLARAAAERWLCLFDHDPDHVGGYFREAGKKPVFEPEARLKAVRGSSA